MNETWDLWINGVGATGMSFARSVVDSAAAGDRVLVHAAPAVLDVTVRGTDERVTARGLDLTRGDGGPMSYLVRVGDTIRLEDGWPTADDLGRLVILPGGEVGVLKEWWHAEDKSEWRWDLEFWNHL